MTARTVRRPTAGLLALALAALLTGCGSAGTGSAGSGEKEAASSTSVDKDADSAAPSLGTVKSVACPGEAKAVPLPDGMRAPLPEKVVVVDVRGPVGGRTVVTGVVPAAERDVLAELQESYPDAGFTLTEGETEPHDAESNFVGSEVKGRWAIRELPDCSPVATRIDVVVAGS